MKDNVLGPNNHLSDYAKNVFSILIQSWIERIEIPVKYTIPIEHSKEVQLERLGILIKRSKDGTVESIICRRIYNNLNIEQIEQILNELDIS